MVIQKVLATLHAQESVDDARRKGLTRMRIKNVTDQNNTKLNNSSFDRFELEDFRKFFHVFQVLMNECVKCI